MEPPIPTDNLYKFLALSGVAICILSVSLPTVRHQSLKDRLWSTQEQVALLKVDEQDLNEQAASLKRKGNELRDATQRLLQFVRQQQKDVATHRLKDKATIKAYTDEDRRGMAEIQQNAKEYGAADEALRKTEIEERKKLYLIDQKLKQIEELHSELAIISYTSIFSLTFGFWLAQKGFTLWYQRSQKYIDQDAVIAQEVAETNRDLAQVNLKKARLDLKAAEEAVTPNPPKPERRGGARRR